MLEVPTMMVAVIVVVVLIIVSVVIMAAGLLRAKEKDQYDALNKKDDETRSSARK